MSDRTPNEQITDKLGKPQKDAPEDRGMSVDELYGTKQNPLREETLPAAGLRDAGGPSKT